MQYAYDEAKFKELLLYAAEQLEGDPASGAIKLNKVLFFSEFAHMRAFGRPITGAEYQKLEHGPAPRRLIPVREALIHDGDAVLKPATYMGYQQQRLLPVRKADRSVFTAQELEVVDQVVADLKGASGADVSALSHEEMGWQMVDEGETIPFEAAYLAPPKLTQSIKDHAAGLSQRKGA